MIQKIVTIINKLGLHARASAKFVAEASRFSSKIEIAVDSQRINGKSIMGLMMLGVTQDTPIELIIEGPDEAAAMQALTALIASRFGEGA
jgi:phosphocarrier protein